MGISSANILFSLDEKTQMKMFSPFVFLLALISTISLCHGVTENVMRFERSSVLFMCDSNVTPIWNRIKSSDDVKNLAIGAQRMTRFSDLR